MDEADWLSSTDPQAMLTFLRNSGRGSERKLRLLACGCCWGVWRWHNNEMFRMAVQVGERFAEGSASEAERDTALASMADATGSYSDEVAYARLPAAEWDEAVDRVESLNAAASALAANAWTGVREVTAFDSYAGHKSR